MPIAKRRLAERGQTVAELVVVIAVIAIVASIALPGVGTGDEQATDLVAAEIAGAMRHARAESMRTGVVHGVQVDITNQNVRVYRLDKSGATPLYVYDVEHPLTHQAYAVDLVDGSLPAGSALLERQFNFEGLAETPDSLSFRGDGTPVHDAGSAEGADAWSWCWWCSAGGETGGLYMLQDAYVRIGYRDEQRKIVVEPMTGRVTVQ